jgi:hypothetical protein
MNTMIISLSKKPVNKDMLHTKQKLLGLCKETQKRMVESAKEAMNEAQNALNEYGPNKDRYDSFREQLIGRRDMFASQYQKALTDMNVLEKINCKELKKKVEFGAIIISDVSKYVIAISSGKIECDGEIYYAISPAVPIYKVMHGLKQGDSFEFNGKRQTIKELF